MANKGKVVDLSESTTRRAGQARKTTHPRREERRNRAALRAADREAMSPEQRRLKDFQTASRHNGRPTVAERDSLIEAGLLIRGRMV